MKPILYEPSETLFNNNGIGVLADAITCVVTEERNGAFELEMTYPIDGLHFNSLQSRFLILAMPNPIDDPQPFRIYRISKPMKGMVKINAEHISYDLSGIPLSPFTAESISEAISKFNSQAAVQNKFEFYTDKTVVANFAVNAPSSTRSYMGGQSGSLLDVYGGEYKYDRFQIKLLSQRGANNGVSIRYGKNLIDLTQEENIQNVFTGVYPFYKTDDAYLELPEKIIAADGNYDYEKIKPLDLSQDFDEPPTIDTLRASALAYIKSNDIGKPKVSLSVSFISLEQTEEYKDSPLLERVLLCDTVNVHFEKMNINATAKIVKVIYDCLLDRYSSLELGDAKTNIADTILSQKKQIETVSKGTDIQDAIKNATELITGNKGGFVVLHSSTGRQQPDEILIMDKSDIATATKVWRWNNGGLGFSANGYNGPYATAITNDGKFVADFITVGSLTANIIKGGLLQDKLGKNCINLDSGEANLTGNITSTKVNIDGYDIYSKLSNNGIHFYINNTETAYLKMLYGDYGRMTLLSDTVKTECLDIFDKQTNIMSGGLVFNKSDKEVDCYAGCFSIVTSAGINGMGSNPVIYKKDGKIITKTQKLIIDNKDIYLDDSGFVKWRYSQ